MKPPSEKKTITVGIPAYNEARNIRPFLEGVLRQRFQEVVLLEILVYSDGSTDATVAEAQAVADRRIRVMSGTQRQGANSTQNALFREAQGDVIILLNADTLLHDATTLECLASAVVKDQRIGIAAAKVTSLPGYSWMEKIIVTSHDFKIKLFESIAKNGDNIYLCNGRARAFSREFAQKLRWPDQCPEDAYSYILCKSKDLIFRYVPEARIFFRSPNTWADHRKQSKRFAYGKVALRTYFSQKLLKKMYHLPRFQTLGIILRFFLHHPIHMFFYFTILTCARLFTMGKNEQSRWQISTSTKTLVSN